MSARKSPDVSACRTPARKGSGGHLGPVAVPEKIFGLTLFLDFFDRGHPPDVLARAGGHLGPVAVPEKIFGLTLFLDFFDRGHSLASLLPPLAAVGSLPAPTPMNMTFTTVGADLCVGPKTPGCVGP